MATKISNFSKGSAGSTSITGIPFMPNHVDFYVAQKNATTENFAHFSAGSANGSTQMAHSAFQDTTGGKTLSSTSKCVSHLNRVSGTISEIISASFVSFDDNGGGDYGFTLNFTAADANYKIYFIARD